MTLDPVVTALTAAIAASDSVDLRVALGKHLLSKGEAAEALVHFEAGLSQVPQSTEALQGAQQAAQDCGKSARATAYELALAALSGTAEEEEEPIELSSVSAGTRVKSKGPNLVVVTEDYIEEAESVITFDDVGGLDDVKNRLHRSFLLPLQQPEVFARYGKQIGGGLLLFMFALLVPRFVKDVLLQDPDDSVFIFWPVGLGAIMALRLLVVLGRRYSPTGIVTVGLFGLSLAIAAMGGVDFLVEFLQEQQPWDLLGPDQVLGTSLQKHGVGLQAR